MGVVRCNAARSFAIGLVSGAAVVAALPHLSVDARADVLVTPANMNGWSVNSRDSSGAVNSNPGAVGAMVTGPAAPPLGTGSAQLAAGNGTAGGDGAEELSTAGYTGVALSSITSLTYWTYDTKNNGSQFPYLTLAISYTGASSPDILFFEPPYQTPTSGNGSLPNQGATQMNQWQPWNALAGGWWSDNSGNAGTGVEPLWS